MALVFDDAGEQVFDDHGNAVVTPPLVFTVMGPAGSPSRPPYPFALPAKFGQLFTVMGPAGSPMRPPYASFVKPLPKSGLFTVMGPGGPPMRPPYGSFAGKPGSATVTAAPHLQLFIGGTLGRMWIRP